MTMQEYFDKTVAHLRSMDRQAIDEPGGSCVYLTSDGRKCAVGIHIPDGHSGQFHDGGVMSLLNCCPDLKGVATPDHVQGLELAKELQNAHDGPYWEDGGFVGEYTLKKIAEDFGLTYTPPENNDV